MNKAISSLISALSIFLIFLINAADSNASENAYITIVNPVRIAPYTQNISDSISKQYESISEYGLHATWLLTYDALKNSEAIEVVSNFDNRQELGIFLEVGKDWASEAGVTYNDKGTWHYATNVFLSGYEQSERKLLIDKIFEDFKKTFGYYPKSVGSWWTDSFSLSYMQEKYGVFVNLTCADQYATDNYQLWGQYWGYPFYPSKNHSGIPASLAGEKIDVLMIQWASRDPLQGYEKSIYSVQDYHLEGVNQNSDYFENLVNTYLDTTYNEIGYIVLGLESDLDPQAYSTGIYISQLEIIKKYVESGRAQLINASDFAALYKENFSQNLDYFISSSDYFGSNRRVFWYMNPRYRIGLIYENKTLEIFDLRRYSTSIYEPNRIIPNKELKLSINIPSYIDKISFPERTLKIEVGGFKNATKEEGAVKLFFENGNIVLNRNAIEILGTDIGSSSKDTISILKANTSLRVSDDLKIEFADEALAEEVYFKSITREGEFFLARNVVKLIVLSALITIIFVVLFISKSKLNISLKMVIILSLVLAMSLPGVFWYSKNTSTYAVHQEEVEALRFLSTLPKGKILVNSKTCVGCKYWTKFVPAIYEDRRGYIEKYSGMEVVKNEYFFETNELNDAKLIFGSIDPQYIYLASYGEYIERVPFSPGDFGIEKVFDNAYAEIWRVKR